MYYNQEIYASDVHEEFSLQEKIREAYREHRLFCSSCGGEVLYKHCTERESHFAHKDNTGKCEYERYFKTVKKRSDEAKKIITTFYLQFKDKYMNYQINRDVRLVSKHYTDISIETPTKTVAIEFVNEYKAPKYMDEICKAYEDTHLGYIIIVIDEYRGETIESDFNYAKRYALNKGNGILLLKSPNDNSIQLIKQDKSGFSELSVFSYRTIFSDIDIIDNQHYSDDFIVAYNKFVNDREIAYKKQREEQRIAAEKERIAMVAYIKSVNDQKCSTNNQKTAYGKVLNDQQVACESRRKEQDLKTRKQPTEQDYKVKLYSMLEKCHYDEVEHDCKNDRQKARDLLWLYRYNGYAKRTIEKNLGDLIRDLEQEEKEP
ncbi:MAG: hypothetical protein LBL66_07210 [Clostridiales bacterium]|nr:hypothetical protein [Clostridiales bacterium]